MAAVRTRVHRYEGDCPVCGLTVALRLDGQTWLHKRRFKDGDRVWCPGGVVGRLERREIPAKSW